MVRAGGQEHGHRPGVQAAGGGGGQDAGGVHQEGARAAARGHGRGHDGVSRAALGVSRGARARARYILGVVYHIQGQKYPQALCPATLRSDVSPHTISDKKILEEFSHLPFPLIFPYITEGSVKEGKSLRFLPLFGHFDLK